MDTTQEVIYLLNELFYYCPDFDMWPESAKLFRERMMTIVGRFIHESRLSAEEIKRILEAERS